MTISEQPEIKNWREIVKSIDVDSPEWDPASLGIDEDLKYQVQRIKGSEISPESKEMLRKLKDLAEGILTAEQQRDAICALAAKYSVFLGWEGETGDEPGW